MPLPDGGSVPWPPPQCEPINQQYATWAAWWTGDVEQLAGIYAGDGAGRDTTGFFASERGGFRSGVRRAAGAVRRWFWGDRAAATQQRTRLHVPIAADIASASADLLFSEPPTLTADAHPGQDDGGQADATAQARLDLLWDDNTHAVLLEAAEICAALGGVYLRIVWGPDRQFPWITAVQPDVAVPEWRWGSLSAVTFWREVARKGKTVWRHLERHEPGVVLHGLYEGTVDELGHPVPLTDQPATAALADERLVNGNEIRTGTPRLTAVYVPNVKPNRVWRNMPEAANLGRADIAGVEPLMDALDLTWSSWVRDVDLGKARLVVPQEYMRSNGPGAGASVDLDREVYEPVNAMGSESGEKIQIEQVQFDIRVTEHQATVDALKAAIVGSAGYSMGTFGDRDATGAAVTATEITARDRRSLITRDRKGRYWRSSLTDLLETWTWVDAAQYKSGIRPQRPVLDWPAAVSVDPLAQAQTLAQLETAAAISTEQKVRTLHPDWDDAKVGEEVARIKADHSTAVQDPGTFTGAAPDPGAVPPGRG
jgi:A118 family predicted phage portal protein